MLPINRRMQYPGGKCNMGHARILSSLVVLSDELALQATSTTQEAPSGLAWDLVSRIFRRAMSSEASPAFIDPFSPQGSDLVLPWLVPRSSLCYM